MKSSNLKNIYAVHTDRSIWRRLEWFSKGHRFGPTVIDRYIFVEILVPFIVALFFFTTILMSLVLNDIIGELLGKGIPFLKILQYIGYLIGEKMTQTIPLASLFSGIMAAGRLSGDSEITAMRSAGISFPRIYSVFLVFGLFSASGVTAMNMYFGPMNARAREDFEDWLKAYHSLTLVQPGKFLGRANMDGVSRKGQDIYAESRIGDTLYHVQIREWFNGLDEKKSERVFIRDMSIPIGDGFLTQIVHAKEGELLTRLTKEGKEEKFLRLKRGFVIEVDEERTGYQLTSFDESFMDYAIPPPVKPLGRINVRPDNYTFPELFEFLEKLEKGGTEIDPCSLQPDCKGSNASAMSAKVGVGETKTDGSPESNPGVIVMPGLSEMEASIMQLRFWVLANTSKVGTPGGPTREEYQQRVQIWLQLQTFLQDAAKTKIRFEVEIQRRIALPVSCLLFFFVSFPLGLVVKRSGKGMGFSMALLVFALYYIFFSFGLSQAYAQKVSAFTGAWLPNLAVGVLGVYIMATRTDGFAPLSFLMKPFFWLWKHIVKILRRVLPQRFWNVFDRVIFVISGIIDKVKDFVINSISYVFDFIKRKLPLKR